MERAAPDHPAQNNNVDTLVLKVIYHFLYSMNNFVTNKSKLLQDGAQVFPYMGWLAIMWPSQRTLSKDPLI